jgi:hypothetical protein
MLPLNPSALACSLVFLVVKALAKRLVVDVRSGLLYVSGLVLGMLLLASACCCVTSRGCHAFGALRLSCVQLYSLFLLALLQQIPTGIPRLL